MSKKMNQRQKDAAHTRRRAWHWRVSIRTMQGWKATGVPVDSDADMVEWYRAIDYDSQKKMKSTFRDRIAEIKRAHEVKTNGHEVSQDWVDFWRERVQKALEAGRINQDLASRLFEKLDRGETPPAGMS